MEEKLPLIPYGISNFKKIRTENYLYVDKTRFIEEVEKSSILIHLRPRRFGKSLFLSMIESYYDVAQSDQFDKLFNGLYIHKNPTKRKNSYYVLRFNFSGVGSTAEEDLKAGFLRKVNEGTKRFINHYLLNIKLNEKETEPVGVLGHLLTEFHGLKLEHKIYLLIDEYDHFTNGLLKGDAKDFLTVLTEGGFVRSFYEVIKEQTELGVVDRFFATGVMSVSLDSMTSGFNIATNITTNRRFANMMGFTGDEVKDILQQLILSEAEKTEIYNVLKEHYNGYLFSEDSGVKVFNSTLIMYYLKSVMIEGRPPKILIDKNLNQSGVTIENIVSLKTKERNYEAVERIIDDKQARGSLSNFIDIKKKFDHNDFITMLFNIGLLTIKKPGVTTTFEIPNKVMENVYLEYLVDLTQKQANYHINTEKHELALVQLGEDGDIRPITDLVSDFLTHTAVRNKQKFDEKYVKLTYMMLLATNNQFITHDEYPAGQGFIDLFIQKTPASYATYEYAIELKYLKIGDTTDAKIEVKMVEARAKMDQYLTDKRVSNRPNLKKFIIVFSGFDMVRMEEVL